jgi:chromosome segregation protein
MASSENHGVSRLKSLELQGYKTFASKNVFEFAPTITAIVGPNGSGKSNIADAIRWALGEQSYSLLRGKKTEDMIFSGSETRSRAGMASATIVFDNEEGWLPIEFSEVTVGRRAYRDSVNEYYLNNQKVRLRDVSELLAECGLSQRTYTIIGQGLVDAALSLNPEERRRLFEEAAGISLYRSRKEEALRRLVSTRRNLERVQDILAELRPRLRSLERQAKRAVDFEQVKDDLNSVLRTWYGYHWYHLQDQVTEALTSADDFRTTRDKLRDQQQKAESELLEIRSRITSLRDHVQTWTQEVSDLHRQRESVDRSLAVAAERTRWLNDQASVLEAEIASTDKRRESLRQRLDDERSDAEDRHKELEEAQSSIRLLRSDESEEESSVTKDIPQDLEGLRKDLAHMIAEEARCVTQAEQLNNRHEALNEMHEEQSAREDSLQVTLEQIKENESRITGLLDRAKKEREDLGNQKAENEQLLKDSRQQREDLSSELLQLKMRRAAFEARLELARAAQKGLDETVEIIQRGSKAGNVDGFIGVLDERIRVRSMYQPAIYAALGEHRTALAFQSIEAIDNAIESVRDSHRQNRVAFLPLSGGRAPSDLDPATFPGSLGIAVEFVEAEEEFQQLLHLILGRTLVVRNVEEARKQSDRLPFDARIVTLDGTVVLPTGLVILGSDAEDLLETGSIDQLEANLTETDSKIQTLDTQRGDLDQKLIDSESHLNSLLIMVDELGKRTHEAQAKRDQYLLEMNMKQSEREALVNELENIRQEQAEIQNQLTSLQEESGNYRTRKIELENALQAAILLGEGDQSAFVIAQAQTRFEVSQRVYEGVENRLTDLSEQLQEVEADHEFKASRLDSIQRELSETSEEIAQGEESRSALENQITEAREKIEPEEKALRESEEIRTSLETEEMQNRAGLQNAEREHSRAQIHLARRQEELVSLQRRIEDDFGLVTFDFENGVMGQDPLPFEGLVEHLPRVEEVAEETESQVNRLRNQLRRLGAVNPSAKIEYDEVRNRVDFLTTQTEDSHKAEEQIQNVIAELDLLMEREFRKTFDAVAIEFQHAFTHLFGGGSARLGLTNSEDLTQTGIDIEARLPGRREQGLAMLSGGERSLTASALIFALMKVSPTPFCVLDEVDAMLDDVNVVRFREMLQDLSKNTQFVVITHNRMTVQVAEVVYGVTMGSDSASQIISLRLEDAEKVLAGKG